MADVSTPEENARKILAIYDHFHAKPGHVLKASNFVAIGDNNRWRIRELQQGLELALSNGWVEHTGAGLRLTSTGYENYDHLSDQQR